MQARPEHDLLLRWLILTGLIVFAVVIIWHQNIFSLLFAVDKSYISWLIALIYILVTLHCAMRTYTISSEMNLALKVDTIIKSVSNLDLRIENEKMRVNNQTTLPDCYMTDYIKDLYNRHKNTVTTEDLNPSSTLIEVYESRMKNPQEIGWFISDMMLKLGLLGTIIGFIFMLGSVANIANFDVSNMQKVLRHMSNGMGIALYTTLIGLICSILSAIQYHILDKHADEITALMQHLTQIHIVPKLK